MKEIEYNMLVIKEKRKIDSWRGRSGAADRARSKVSYWTQNYGKFRNVRNVSSVVNKTRNIQIFLTNHILVTEMGQCGPWKNPRISDISRGVTACTPKRTCIQLGYKFVV